MKQTIIILLALLAFPAAGVGAQGIGDVLRSIEQNNKELQALRKDNEAATAEIKSQNNLEDPSVEYSPFFRRGARGVASSDSTSPQFTPHEASRANCNAKHSTCNTRPHAETYCSAPRTFASTSYT